MVPVPGRLCLRQFAEAEFRGAPPGRRRRVLPARCNYGPLEFPDGTIEALYFADHKRRQAFLYEQHCRKENERHEQIQHLRGQLRKILPKGRKAGVSMVDDAESAIDFLSPQIKERVQTIISGLNSLTADAEVENLRNAV